MGSNCRHLYFMSENTKESDFKLLTQEYTAPRWGPFLMYSFRNTELGAGYLSYSSVSTLQLT